MNWSHLRKINDRKAKRKAKGERLEIERSARIARAGGEISAAEIRASTWRIEPPAPGHTHDRLVLNFRGLDWVLGFSDCEWPVSSWYSLCPFQPWLQTPDLRQAIPLTAGGRKALAKKMAEIYKDAEDENMYGVDD